ncbi:hypothetical protein O988_05468 [Pseudogymnoascus sp. VKM F-3808]|nr:hypothetical protein O988_05468 [Pseudogymnoascus sp. VKM F-3808]
MKVSALILAVLAPAAILAAPSSEAEAMNSIAERATDYCIVSTDGVRYRTCAKTSCTAIGQYNKGTKLHIAGSAVGESINGKIIWWKLDNGYYISEYYCP